MTHPTKRNESVGQSCTLVMSQNTTETIVPTLLVLARVTGRETSNRTVCGRLVILTAF